LDLHAFLSSRHLFFTFFIPFTLFRYRSDGGCQLINTV